MTSLRTSAVVFIIAALCLAAGSGCGGTAPGITTDSGQVNPPVTSGSTPQTTATTPTTGASPQLLLFTQPG